MGFLVYIPVLTARSELLTCTTSAKMCFEARLALLQGFPGLVLRRNEGPYFLFVSRPIIGLVSVKEETEPKSITDSIDRNGI